MGRQLHNYNTSNIQIKCEDEDPLLFKRREVWRKDMC